MDPIAKFLIIAGALLVIAGVAWQFGLLQALRLGRLPGDIFIDNDNVKIYIPITTGLLLSVIFSLLAWLFKK